MNDVECKVCGCTPEKPCLSLTAVCEIQTTEPVCTHCLAIAWGQLDPANVQHAQPRKAITICQPHAAAVVQGPKLIENRTWPTTYRGWLLIHAGKSRQWFNQQTTDFYAARCFTVRAQSDYHYGAIIGLAYLTASVPIDELADSLRDDVRNCAEGPFCWVLDQRLSFSPIPAVGKQGLWNYTGPLPRAAYEFMVRKVTSR